MLRVSTDQLSSDVGVKLLVERTHLLPQLLDRLSEVVRLERRAPVRAVVREPSIQSRINHFSLVF